MSRHSRRRSHKSGLPPGTLVHIGEERKGKAAIQIMDYDGEHFEEKEVRTVAECFPYRDRSTTTWINVEGVHDLPVIEALGQHFQLHPLILEDIVNTTQRPKMEDFGDYIFIVIKMLSASGPDDEIKVEQASLVLGRNFVISFQEGAEGDVFDHVRERLRGGKGRMRKLGADYLAYALLDVIVDHYFVILEKLGDTIEDLEADVVAEPTTDTIRVIHRMKRELILLRKSVWPLRELIIGLERAESDLFQESTAVYLRDVYDHSIQVIDTIETYREMLSGMLDIYLSSVSNRMNAVMKVLTVIATIFMPLTFLAGVYGMNFKYMPELQWRFGYPAVWLAMVVVGGVMLAYFRRKKWL